MSFAPNRASYEPLRDIPEGRTAALNHQQFSDDEAPLDENGGQGVSRFLSIYELKDLYSARGRMPPINQTHPAAAYSVDAAVQRVDQLDLDLFSYVRDICDRIGNSESASTTCDRWRTWVLRYLRLGIIRAIIPQTLFYVVYSLGVCYYVSEYREDWDVRWSAAKQDAIYYPAVVLAFLLCFRASGCMDRYKEGLRTSFEMEKALREVAFEVMTSLTIEAEEEAGGTRHPDMPLRSVKKSYFKHEFRRLVRLLFACAARDLNDSAIGEDSDALDEDEVVRIPFAMTQVEHAAIMVTHAALGHAFRVYLASSWVLKLLKRAVEEDFFEDVDIYRSTEDKLTAFKSAWLDARQVAYSSMPGSVTHILWLLTTIMSLFMPWEWVGVCRWSTWVPSILLSISFFGIMEIASSMENPFGFDEDDIQIWKVAQHLDEEICLTMHYSLLDEFGGENLYRSIMGCDMIFLEEESHSEKNEPGQST